MAVSVVHSQSFSQLWSGTLTNTPTVGNSLIIGTTWFSTSGANGVTTGVTYGGSSGTPFNLKEARSPSAGNRVATSLWIIPNLTSANTSWSVTWSPASGTATVVGSVVLEVSGLGTAPTLETSAGNSGSTGSVDSGASGTATAGDLIVGMGVQFGAAFTPPGAPWTNLNIGGANDSVLGYQILGSGGTVDYPGAGASSADWAAIVAAVLPTASGVSAALTVAQETVAALPLSPKVFLTAAVAQETISAPAPAPKLALPAAVVQDAIAAGPLGPKLALAAAVAQENISAPALSPKLTLALPVAQVSVSAPTPTASIGGQIRALSVAQVTVAAPAPAAQVGPVSAALSVARVNVSAPAPTVHTGSFLPPIGAGGGSVSWAQPGGGVTESLPGGSVTSGLPGGSAQ